MHLAYFADPMCSWCYGFGPQLAKLPERHPDARLEPVMGGLRACNREAMGAGTETFARAAHRSGDSPVRRWLVKLPLASFAVLLLSSGPALAAAPAAPAASASARKNAEDFDAFWRAIDSRYAYFDGDRTPWRRARNVWRPRALAARTRSDLVKALEGAAAELRDDHVTLSERTAESPRRIPAEADIWARFKDGAAVVTAVRAFSDADVAGLHPGHVITHVQGRPVERAVRERLGSGARHGAASRDWALRQVLANPAEGVLNLEARDPEGGPRSLGIERAAAVPADGPPIIARRMGESRDLGYIRLKNVLGDDRLAGQFDGALNDLKDARALIIDLRETPAGMSRAVTEAVLSRFVEAETAWQVREVPGRKRIVDKVAPRGGAPYLRRVLVLVDRWTAGQGEALAAGLQAVARATLVGTPMAGLRGELHAVTLPHSGIVARFPAEKALLVNGAPRETLGPAVEVDLAAPNGGPGDPILYQALKILEPGSRQAARVPSR